MGTCVEAAPYIILESGHGLWSALPPAPTVFRLLPSAAFLFLYRALLSSYSRALSRLESLLDSRFQTLQTVLPSLSTILHWSESDRGRCNLDLVFRHVFSLGWLLSSESVGSLARLDAGRVVRGEG